MSGSKEDIVVAAARPAPRTPVRVFGEKTQGQPYHFAVLAAAMLVEERFPRHAMVWGDIDLGQAETARKMAAPILGRQLPLPVRVDPERLAKRLRAHYRGADLPAAFTRVLLSDLHEHLEIMLRTFPGEPGASQWQRELAEYESPGAPGAVRELVAWLNAGRDLREACRLACLDKKGPRFSPEAFADALVSTWVAIPRSARAPFDVFNKPKGAVYTIGSLLDSIIIDEEAMGRHLRVHLKPATLAAELSAAFGDQGSTLAKRLLQKSARLEKVLRRQAKGLRALVTRAKEQRRDDPEALATLRSPKAIGHGQQLWVLAAAWLTRDMLACIRSGDLRVDVALASAKETRHVLARVLTKKGPVLTEDAWEALFSEDDVDVLAWCVALVGTPDDEVSQAHARRALLENARLRRYAMALGQDKRQMRKMDAMVAKARALERKAGTSR